MSEIRSFKTAPPIGSEVSYKFIVYGDMGITAAARTTAKYALKDVLDGYEFIFHNGDISYARGNVRRKNSTGFLRLRWFSSVVTWTNERWRSQFL